jgi:hypothetical protein
MRAATARLAMLITACLLLTGLAAAQPFKDDAGKFSARFPAAPTLDKQEGSSVSGPHVHYTWEVDHEGRHFSVTYTEYTTAPVKNYDKNVMGMLAATKGKLLRQSKIDLRGVDGRETYTLLPDNAVMRQRLFQVGNRLYQAVYAGPFGTESREDVEVFMASFQILE